MVFRFEADVQTQITDMNLKVINHKSYTQEVALSLQMLHAQTIELRTYDVFEALEGLRQGKSFSLILLLRRW